MSFIINNIHIYTSYFKAVGHHVQFMNNKYISLIKLESISIVLGRYQNGVDYNVFLALN